MRKKTTGVNPIVSFYLNFQLIFWLFSTGFSVGFRWDCDNYCQGAIKNSPFVPLKTAFYHFTLFFSFKLSDLILSALFSALFPAFDQLHHLTLSQ
ncbi:MAG: hypothetical protein SOX46_04150 [Clostridiaceae bacterium]|uniref:Uncharacterized protein n=1 Tax=Clostridium porci TaxID=2605778 RepID=A0A7X2TD59_9CLOT|nr:MULTISPECIES: hypothetical protein [Clostridium]MCI6138489.1 hypothetical protein [Clostridium sp.]MDY3230759.1 hypothetical protein [Clostridiaceae bacterium]MSS37719.1 hypothetical protein [Clostridium porci]